ncbi:MAG: ATP-binding protein [Fimbriimonadaceae bacterium]
MYPRLAEERVRAAMGDTPVVVVQGPRQCGKTTLVRRFVGEGVPFVTLDDSLALDAAVRNPDAFVSQFRGSVVIDEVQRAPGVFRAIKKSVDADRRPGRFLLTGSSNVLLLPRLSESLAGRMEVVPLWPLCQAEVEGVEGGFVQRVFAAGDPSPLAPLPRRGEGDCWERVLRGGFPEPLSRSTKDRASAWFDSYIKTVTERDVRDLSDIEGLTAMPRLLKVLARHCGESVNVSRVSREVGIPHTTLTRYLSLLESVFVLRPLHAWSHGAKTAKLQFSDPGVLAHLLGIDDVRAADESSLLRLLECFVSCEIVRLVDGCGSRTLVQHFRSLRTWSVPVVLESASGEVVGVSVTADPVPAPSAFRGLEVLADIAGERFLRGVVLHTGASSAVYKDGFVGLPVSSLWE